MLILNEPKVGGAGGALGTACLPGGKEPSWASPPTSSVLCCRLSRGGPLPLRPAHHEISIPLAAFGTAQQPRPIGHRHAPYATVLNSRRKASASSSSSKTAS